MEQKQIYLVRTNQRILSTRAYSIIEARENIAPALCDDEEITLVEAMSDTDLYRQWRPDAA